MTENSVIQGLLQHKSLRRFNDRPINESLISDLIAAGQAVASSSYIQAVTVIRIVDQAKRQQIQQLAGDQVYISQAPEFWLFCADLQRAKQCAERHGKMARLGFTEQMIIATVDTALFAQNVVVAAEASGLGICYIGAVRNNPQAISDLAGLPDQVYPVFGLCLGYSAHHSNITPKQKPRLPQAVVFKQDVYDDNADAGLIASYDEKVRAYYARRSSNPKVQGWSEQMADMLAKESRLHMREFLQSRGLMLR